jgi:hypothetical protein
MPGSVECIARLGVIETQFRTAGAKAVKDWGEETIQEARTVDCPIDTGLLQSTGEVIVTKNTLTEFEITLQFGGHGCTYAVPVHETPKNYKNGKHWKYLTGPFNRRLPLLHQKLEVEIGRVLQ